MAAIEGLEEVIQLEQQSDARKDPQQQQQQAIRTDGCCFGPWGYKAMKQLVKLH